jgi:hypothetical protein
VRATAGHIEAMDDPKLETPPAEPAPAPAKKPAKPPETGGPEGPEPTRYGDWERNGRCVDF